MRVLEFGKKENTKIVFIHGFQSPYQAWTPFIDYYKNKFHIIVPILSGHYPGEPEDFISFEHEAKQFEEYYLLNYGNDLYAMFGLSMGGVLAATLWQNKRINIQKMIFDGSPLVGYNQFIKKMLTKFYLDITHKTQQRDEKTVKQAVGSIISKDNLNDFLCVLDCMSDTTVINCINSVGSYKLPCKIDTPNTSLYFFHGTKLNEMFAKKTAKLIGRNYPNAFIHCFKGKGHCENSLIYPEAMIRELENILL